MKQVLLGVAELMRGDVQADRVVPPTGFTVRLTLFSAAAMAFLAVFAMALCVTTARLAHDWGGELARSATLQIEAPADKLPALTQAALNVLKTTEGVASARALTADEQKALLEPWLGKDVALGDLPVPQLIAIKETSRGIDADALRLRLQGEVPGAVLNDHGQWRRPLLSAAHRLRLFGILSLLLIMGVMAAMITLATQSALAANVQVIEVLRLVGARDAFVARAFVRRYTLRALWGALAGTGLGMLAILALPRAGSEGSFLTGLGFHGAGWLWPVLVPVAAAVVAFLSTRGATRRMLSELA